MSANFFFEVPLDPVTIIMTNDVPMSEMSRDEIWKFLKILENSWKFLKIRENSWKLAIFWQPTNFENTWKFDSSATAAAEWSQIILGTVEIQQESEIPRRSRAVNQVPKNFTFFYQICTTWNSSTLALSPRSLKPWMGS